MVHNKITFDPSKYKDNLQKLSNTDRVKPKPLYQLAFQYEDYNKEKGNMSMLFHDMSKVGEDGENAKSNNNRHGKYDNMANKISLKESRERIVIIETLSESKGDSPIPLDSG